jgi:hypothetical protein
MPEISSCFRSRTFCCADAGIFRKRHKIKMTGKTAGDSPHGGGELQDLEKFLANSVKKCNSHCLLILY